MLVRHIGIGNHAIAKSFPVRTVTYAIEDSTREIVGATEIAGKGKCTILRKLQVGSVCTFGRCVTIDRHILHLDIGVKQE